MSDRDLEVRRVGQRVDPLTGEVFTQDAYNPDKTTKVSAHKNIYSFKK